jgi:small subunit ribosomal protein S3Ae
MAIGKNKRLTKGKKG